MTTPFPFVSAAVLTAAQMNAITTLVTSTKTASHTLTIADVSTRVIMNSASATTITVNTSIFGASDVVEILNIGAGVCTVTAGTCTVGTSGTLALVQNAGGTLTFISASASVFRATGVTAAAGGLVFLAAATFSAVTSVSTAALFTATYNDYLLLVDQDGASVEGVTLRYRLRVAGVDNTTSNYRYHLVGALGTTFDAIATSGTSGELGGLFSAGYGSMRAEILAPQVANETKLLVQTHGRTAAATFQSYQGGHVFTATTQFDAITLFPDSGTFTGRYALYGYSKS